MLNVRLHIPMTHDNDVNRYAGTARMLTVLALYYSYSEGDDAFLVRHFVKAQGLATLLLARRTASLMYGKSDPRYGIPRADDEGRDGVAQSVMNGDAAPLHWYASAAELYRACSEMGKVWVRVGKAAGRADISKHGAELVALAPVIQADLQTSLNKTAQLAQSRAGTASTTAATTAATNTARPDEEERCWQLAADANSSSAKPSSFRGFAEMMYSGALSKTQVDDIIVQSSGGSACGGLRFLTLLSPGLSSSTTISSPSSYGYGFGLLQHDMVERFLLHFFAMSAHSYTRGTFTTPESSNVADRDEPAVAYTAAGVVVTTVYLKWMLAFEEPETQTLWLAKATPRDWLAVGENPLAVANLTTQYGRMSFSLTPPPRVSRSVEGTQATAGYSVEANVTLPASFASNPPPGGIKVRVRAPVQHAGKMTGVTVGGAKWAAFNAAEETIEIAAGKIDAKLIATGLPAIVVTFA